MRALQMWIVLLMESRVFEGDLCGDYEVLHFSGPFQKWSTGVTLASILGFLAAFFIMDQGEFRSSVIWLILVSSLLHLLLMVWVRPMMKDLHGRELAWWFDGHVKNYLWGVFVAVGALVFFK